MKKSIASALLLTSALAILPQVGQAQDKPFPEPAPVPPADAVAPAPPEPIRPPRKSAKIRASLDAVKAGQPDLAEIDREDFDGKGNFMWAEPGGDSPVWFGGMGGSPSSRTLIVRGTGGDPKILATTEEDLSIMSRILMKHLRDQDIDTAKDDVMAMGMKIRTLALGGHSAAQNLYIEGYGALFLFNVPFSLVPPPKPATDEEAVKETGDSTWEEAKRELYGPRDADMGKFKAVRGPSLEYDAHKVDQLKSSITEALKNAANIRSLKPDEFVTVTVTGAGNGPGRRGGPAIEGQNRFVVQQRTIVATRGGGGTVRVGGSGGESVMTVRAKKSDIDAFAKGTLNLDQFKEKTQVSIY